ncbi:Mss4-like protein [Trichoderma evansii]
MPSYNGGCLCCNIRYICSAEPIVKVLCHCSDCRKISGSNYSVNFHIHEAAFQVTLGTPKVFSKVADSGHVINSYFCGNCGIVKARTLDDSSEIISTAVFDIEVFMRSRVEWVQPIAGVSQRVAE